MGIRHFSCCHVASWQRKPGANVIIDWCSPKFMATLAPGRTIYLTITVVQELVSVWRPLVAWSHGRARNLGGQSDRMGVQNH